MPQDRRRYTLEELKQLGLIWPEDTEQAAEAEDPDAPSLLRRGGAIAARLGSGVASSIVGAVPSWVTTPTAGAIGGAGEYLAQYIEAPNKPFNQKKVAAEAALSAIPFSKIYKYGAPVAQNVLRGAGIGIGSNMFRRGVDNEGNPLPTSGSDLAWDVAGGVLGGGAGYLTKVRPGAVPGDEIEDLLAKLGGEGASPNAARLVKPDILGLDRPHITPPSRITRQTAGVGGGLPSTSIIPEGLEERFGALRGLPPGAAQVEASAPIAPGVAAKQAEIDNRPFKVNKSKVPGEEVPLTEANFYANRDEAINRATELAAVQRKAHEATIKEETKLLNAEKQADLQYARSTAGTNLGKSLTDAEKAHVAFIRSEAEAAAKKLKFEEAEAVRKAAQTKIDNYLKGKGTEEVQILKSADKVDTESGTQTLSTVIREKKPEKPDAGGGTGATGGSSPAGTPPRGSGPVNRFITRSEAEKALVTLNKMGRTGHVEPMDPHGNFFHIVFDAPAVEGAATKAVDAPSIPPPDVPPPAAAAPVTPEPPPKPPAPPAAAPSASTPPVVNPTITRKITKPAGHEAYVAEARKWSDDELKQGFAKFGGNNSGLGRAIKQVQDERAAASAVQPPGKTPPPDVPPAAAPVPVAPKPKGPAGPAKAEAPTPATPKEAPPVKAAVPVKAKAPAKPKTLPEGTIPFKDKHGRQKYALKSPNNDNYRIYDAKGRYIASESITSLKAKHGVELGAPKPTPKAEAPAPVKAPVAKPEPPAKPVAKAEPPAKTPVAKPAEKPALPPPAGLKPLTELEKWNALINKYDKKDSIDLHVTLKNLRSSNQQPDDIRAVETILRRRGETVKPAVVAHIEPKKAGPAAPIKIEPASPTQNYRMVPQDKGKWGIRDNKTGEIIYTSKNKDDVANKLERIAKEETTPTVGKRDTPPTAPKPPEKLGGQGPETYPYRGTKMAVEEKAPPIRKEPPKEPPAAAAPVPVKPKPKGPTPPAKTEAKGGQGPENYPYRGTKMNVEEKSVPVRKAEVKEAPAPAGATKVDLTGAKDAPEVQRRVINELEKYQKLVDKAEDSKGVDAKGVTTYGIPLPEPLTLHVPGGPTIKVKPDQVKASIENFEKQGPKPWQGIVDDAPRPTTITVKTGYGQSFGAKAGDAPSVKLPIGPTKGAAPITKAAAKKEPPVVKTEASPTSPELSVEELRAKAKEADAAYGALKDRKNAGEDVRNELDVAGELLGRARHALKLAEMTPEEKAAYLLSKQNKGKVVEPTSDDLAKMTPEEQSKELTRIVNEMNKKGKKGKGLGEKGIGVNELLLHMGAGALGGSIGAANNPDDPVTGALLGLIGGVGSTVAIRAAINHVNNNPSLPNNVREKSKRMIFDKMKDQMDTWGWMFPQYYRASLLSNPASLAINSMVGPYGSGLMAAMEHALAGDPRGFKAVKGFLSLPYFTEHNFPKEFWGSFDPARRMIAEASEKTEGVMATSGPDWFKAMTSAPAWVLTQGDEASRRLLIQAGFSEAEARTITLTSEPFTGWGKGVGRLRGTKGVNEKQSLFLHMILPFWRTNVNQLEQSLVRMPFAGPVLAKVWKNAPISTRHIVAQQIMSGSIIGTAYMAGTLLPKEHAKYGLKAVNNFGGQYGTLAGLAFIAGQANRAGKTPTQQAIAVADGAIFQNWPLPTADTIRDLIRMGKQIDAAKEGHKFDKVRLPYGVVPPVLSSREEVSVPAWMSGRATEEERSIAAPFMRGLTTKKTAKKLSPGQEAIAARKARIKKAKER